MLMSSLGEGFLVAQVIRTGAEQTIAMPTAAGTNNVDVVIVRTEQVRALDKRRVKVDSLIKRGFATLYNQSSEQVKTKLEATNRWENTQNNQLLHELVAKIDHICVGFDNHKEEVFNLAQAPKSLMIYSQGEKETVNEYVQSFKSHWGMYSVFGMFPGVHKSLMTNMLATADWAADHNKLPLIGGQEQ